MFERFNKLAMCLALVGLFTIIFVQNSCASDSFIDMFEQKLKEQGISYGIEMFDPAYVGAIDGKRFNIDNGRVEIYIFDPSSADYEKAAKTGRVTIKQYNLSGPVTQNGTAFIFFDNVDDRRRLLSDIFLFL